jgi:hypothetical protein
MDRLTMLCLVENVPDGAGRSRSEQLHGRRRADTCRFTVRDMEHKAMFVFAATVDHHH